MKVDPIEIQRQIRKAFDFLTAEYGFIEDPDIQTDPIYSEVKFKKNDWGLSILTTAHGTKITMSIISPLGRLGHLYYYFEAIDKAFSDAWWATQDLTGNIEYYTGFIKGRGQEFLTGSPAQLKQILELTEAGHKKFVERHAK